MFCSKCFKANSRDKSKKQHAIFIHHADLERGL
jgi:hypothetical protein